MSNTMLNQIQSFVNLDELAYSKRLLIGMLLSEPDKNCITMSKPLGLQHDVLQKIFNNPIKSIAELKSFLVNLVKDFSKDRSDGWFIGDDTALAKPFARHMEATGLVRDGSDDKNVNGYKIVLICWTNGIITIPFDFKCWFDVDIAKKGFKTKLELMQELILEHKGNLSLKGILLDGLYPSAEMMLFLETNNIIYYMRLPKNRKVAHMPNAISFQIGDNRYFRLKRNSRRGAFKAYFQNTLRYITVSKRFICKNRFTIIYIVSNQNTDAIESLRRYKIRWQIEKLFRTLKQSLGFETCRARSVNKQTLHIFASLSSYALLELIKVDKKFHCPEDSIRYLFSIKDDFICFA